MRRRTALAIGAALFVVAGLVVTAVVAFPSRHVARVASADVPLPLSLEPALFQLCGPRLDRLVAELDADRAAGDLAAQYATMTTEGSGGSFSAVIEAGAWRVEASRAGVTVVNEDGRASSPELAAYLPDAVTAARELYSCFSQYRFVDETTPLASSSQLVQWYKYDSAVLWPCLAAHGLKVGDPPSRADFSDPFRAQGIDPFSGLTVSKATLPKVLAAVRECPAHPSYLR